MKKYKNVIQIFLWLQLPVLIKRQNLYVANITSGVIGIDDWAFKKGNTYGTIIVDLHQNKVIDLLPDRESETICQWLKEHRK